MRRRYSLVGILLVLGAFGSARGARNTGGFSPEAVDRAVSRGVAYLWSRQKANGSWREFKGRARSYPVGPGAMATYALLASGVSPQEARMKKALKWLTESETVLTYDLAFRASALEVAARTNREFLKPLFKDASMLWRSTLRDGGYSYVSNGGRPTRIRTNRTSDNSNAQYGLLGVWAGEMAYAEAPLQYWSRSLDYWQKVQNRDGGWGYNARRRGSCASMTTAGLASLFVCIDNLWADKFVRCNVNNEYKPVKKGLDWMDKNFPASIRQGMKSRAFYYYLYGVERVGLASGYKYFGRSDWYKIGAAKLVRQQQRNGSWKSPGNLSGTDLTATAYALLFLIRGRHPVLFNKLEFHGDWNNRPRDLAALTRWISRTFEATVNWQIINLRVPVREWHDAPIIYISASRAPEFSDDALKKLRMFVWQGGTLFSCTECKGAKFMEGIRKVYAKLFPKYELTPCGPGHELYSVHFPLQGTPKFHALTNGVRPLVIHTDEDLPLNWQLKKFATNRRAFEAAANVFMYVTDKGSLRHRGVSLWPEKPTFAPKRTVKLARLKHSGNYDPEPLAYERFARRMGKEAQTKLEVLGPIDIANLPGSGARVAALTGTGRFKLSDREKQTLKKFAAAGGTLVMDAAGGSKGFEEAAREHLAEMYGLGALRRLAGTSALYRLRGMEIENVKYRRRTRTSLGRTKEPMLRAVLIGGRPAVIFSREDLTAGLVGYPSYTCDGYAPSSAFEIMRNIVLFAAK